MTQTSHLAISPPILTLVLAHLGCAPAPQCPPETAAAQPPPAAAAPGEIRAIVNVSPDPGAVDASVMRGLPELPRPSPGAEVKQRVGLTDVRVTYSSPGAKGRPIWGELVPYGKIWRTGANAPTRLSFNREVTIGDKKVPAGSYSLFTIPTADKWTIILNKDPEQKGAFEHDEKLDVARLEVSAQDAPPRERLTFLFEDTTDEGTKLVLDWAGKRVAVPLKVDTAAHAKQSIDATLDNAWRPLFNAGRYAFEHEKNNQRALELLSQSAAVQSTWWNQWWIAQVHAAEKRFGEARKHAEEAKKLGASDDVYKRAFAEQVDKALASWPAS